jgi:hypothetical protein
VDRLLATTGIDLANGGEITKLMKFQEHFKEYRIVVFGGLNCDDIVSYGQVDPKRINLLYDCFKTLHDKNFDRCDDTEVCRGCVKVA